MKEVLIIVVLVLAALWLGTDLLDIQFNGK